MKKKLFSLIFIFFLCNPFAYEWDSSVAKPLTRFIDGVEYYSITSPEELAWFAYQVNNKGMSNVNAILENDIFFAEDSTKECSTLWTAIGMTKKVPFNGVFDGNNFAIYGLSSQDAFVGFTGENFHLKNLTIKNGNMVTIVISNKGIIENSVESNNPRSKQIAGFAYNNYGTIKKCQANNFGIAINNNGIIEDCQSFGLVQKYSAALFDGGTFGTIYRSPDRAGLVVNNFGTIKNSSFKGNVIFDGNVIFEEMDPFHRTSILFFGGIALNSGANSVIENCDFSGKVKITGTGTKYSEVDFGGIVGVLKENASILNSRARIDSLVIKKVSSGRIGGIVGYGNVQIVSKFRNYISQVFALVNVDTLSASEAGTFYIGGIAGRLSDADLDNSHARINFGNAINVGNLFSASLAGNSTVVAITDGKYSTISNSYGVITSKSNNKYYSFSGIASETSVTYLYNVYYDKTIATPDTMRAVRLGESSSTVNVSGKTTAVMQSPAFVETLNTNAGLDDDSGMWQYCEGNYPILVSEGTCEEFYSKYGFSGVAPQSSSSSVVSSSSVSSSSSVESSSSIEVSSSSVEPSSSSEESSSSAISSEAESSSSDAESSSSKDPEVVDESSSSAESLSSSSTTPLSSSSAATEDHSSSSESVTATFSMARPSFNVQVQGLTVNIFNAGSSPVQVFDMLGHLVTTRNTVEGHASIILPHSGNYLVKVNGNVRNVQVK